MTVTGKCATSASAVVLLTAALAGGSGQFSASALTPAGELASHRAVYELKLLQARGNGTVDARGRILYDFSGNACEGYALQFRQVSLLDNGEGRTALSDMRSTTWEDGDAGSYVFKSQNRLNEQVVDTVDGRAERKSDKIAVTLTKPTDKSVDLTSRHRLSHRSRPPHYRGRPRRQDRAGSAGLRRRGDGRESLQHADGDRPRHRAVRASFRPTPPRVTPNLPA